MNVMDVSDNAAVTLACLALPCLFVAGATVVLDLESKFAVRFRHIFGVAALLLPIPLVLTLLKQWLWP